MAIDLDELPKRMKALEKDAFRDFMLAFAFRLRRIFRHWGLQYVDAESLATSCLTDIALKVDQFSSRGPGSFERWVLHLARNSWIDEWRKRDRASPLADPMRYWYEVPDFEEADPAVAGAVAKALAQLSAADQTIIRLRHLEVEQSFAEIGEKLGLQEGAVRVRHHRALKKLEDFLANHPAIRAWQQRCSPAAVTLERESHE